MELERRQGDRAHLDKTFRAAHSLKGAAAMVGLAPIAEFTHGIEAVLDRIRRGALAVDSDIITTLLEARDHLAAMVEAEAADSPIPAPGRANAAPRRSAPRRPQPRPLPNAPPTPSRRRPSTPNRRPPPGPGAAGVDARPRGPTPPEPEPPTRASEAQARPGEGAEPRRARKPRGSAGEASRSPGRGTPERR